MINEENDYFVLSWDAYDQAHIWDFMYADCDEQHWIRKIVLDCMLQGDYEINQYSQYIGAAEERDEAVEEIIEMMQDNHLTKKEQVAVKKFYDKEFYEECRMFAIVIKSYALEKIYSHKELRSLFESATQLRFQNKNTVFEAFLIDEQISEPNMIGIDEVAKFIDLYNKKIKSHKRKHEENLELANKINSLVDYNTVSKELIDNILATFETESQVIF